MWELYAPDDWTQAHDLSAEQPDKLRELQQLFLAEAKKYDVLPLDDRRVERFNSDLAGRPELIRGHRQLLFGGMVRLTENLVINVENKSHAVTAEIVVPENGANGVIVAQGGAFGGWSLYVTNVGSDSATPSATTTHPRTARSPDGCAGWRSTSPRRRRISTT